MLDLQQTVATVVLDHSECARVFQRHRIDFCCRGDLTIEAAAKEKRVDVERLVKELASAIAARSGEPTRDPRTMSTRELVAHIVMRHHDALRESLPFVRTLAAKVSRVHGAHNPKLRTLETAVEELIDTLEPHVADEEQKLFPALTSDQPDRAVIEDHFTAMHHEHLAVAQLLERIRAASEEFTLPVWACRSYQALFSELEQLEGDLFTHVHLENHVLRPRFVTAS